MLKRLTFILVVLALLAGFTQPARAVLNAVDPGVPPGTYQPAFGNYPQWYQDSFGVALQLCVSQPQLQPTPGPDMCGLLPNLGFDPAALVAFPLNWPEEAFYFAAAATGATAAGQFLFEAALEAAFGNGPVLDTDQVVFARIRIRVDVTDPGTYTVIHPYGVETFTNVDPAAGINFTSDIGLAPLAFTGALNGATGPFLMPSATPGGAPNPPIVVGLESFISTPGVPVKVTNSPFNTNFARIEGPNVGGPGVNAVQIDDFDVTGQLFTGALPTPVTVLRSTFTRSRTSAHVDVFATSSPNSTLTFTGLPAGPVNIPGNGLGSFFAIVPLTNAGALPPSITVTATNPNTTQTSVSALLTDEVIITQAVFDDVNGKLIVQAESSDKSAGATLTAVGFGTMTPNAIGVPTISATVPPPPSVTVQSSGGGSATATVRLGLEPERLRIMEATFNEKPRNWRVSGHSSRPGATIKLFNTANLGRPQMGKAIADKDGLWTIVIKGVRGRRLPNATRQISVSSTGGGQVLNKKVHIHD